MPTYQDLLDSPETHNFVRKVIHLVREDRPDPVDVCKDLVLLSKAAQEETAITFRAAMRVLNQNID
jgi:hypothetical protein